MSENIFWALKITSNIYWVGGIFLAFLLLFHLLLIRIFPLQPKNWKLVEYIWVTLAFVSTLGLVDEARRLNGGILLPQNLNQMESARADVTDWLENYHTHYCKTEGSDTETCGAFQKTARDLDLILQDPQEHPAIPVGLIGRLNGLLDDQADNIIRTRIGEYNKARGAYFETLANSVHSPLQRPLYIPPGLSGLIFF